MRTFLLALALAGLASTAVAEDAVLSSPKGCFAANVQEGRIVAVFDTCPGRVWHWYDNTADGALLSAFVSVPYSDTMVAPSDAETSAYSSLPPPPIEIEKK